MDSRGGHAPTPAMLKIPSPWSGTLVIPGGWLALGDGWGPFGGCGYRAGAALHCGDSRACKVFEYSINSDRSSDLMNVRKPETSFLKEVATRVRSDEEHACCTAGSAG